MFSDSGFGRSVNGKVQNRKVRRKAMNRNQKHSILLSTFAMAALIVASSLPAVAQDANQPYPTRAPVEQY